ncbi:centrosomal protein of 95 kDa isoform X2 [Austrofundulus limnaeus]|uniref:Centrosomal protein of 95 kDa isoform X2 n=1 Tax=Austrofundulus limnaeus TaxID=52670 RepID=A0A2I4CGJ7_AUSLI|nr:PREDICTED: centrosomal protein of 95 kDa-like isoform X2 [Austrofundulus limnaeus]
MGTQEGERNWVDVANDLLSKCHIKLRLRKLTDCNADVFIALYENILGEKVPDYIAAPCSQEDDVHNVQCVIDSLSLDYLQISLSHITGENVVSGDKESIKNLLEIFDGLLEYLNEEINEESQNSSELSDALNPDEPVKTKEPTEVEATTQLEASLPGTSGSPSVESTVQSNKNALRSLNPEEVGSAGELVGPRVSAGTFTDKQEELIVPPQTSDEATPSSCLDNNDPQTEQMHSAVPLQPPKQRDTAHSPGPPPTAADFTGAPGEEDTNPAPTQSTNLVSETLTNGISSPASCSSPVESICCTSAESEKSASSRRGPEPREESETLEPTNGGPRRVLFRTQPDVLFLTLQDEMTTTTPSPPDTDEEEEEELSYRQRFNQRRISRPKRTELGCPSSRQTAQGSSEEPLSYRRKKNKQAEEELHHISENLSHRLEELDQMLKRVLGESGDSSEIRDEDEHSHRSDGIGKCESAPGVSETLHPESTRQTGSSSPSPHRDPRHSFQERLEAAAAGASNLNLKTSDRSRQRKHKKYLENMDYEEELRKYEARERTELHKARLKAQKAEQEYREAILGDVSQVSRRSPPKTKSPPRSQRNRTAAGLKRPEPSRKTSSMKIKENELLPVLRDELPHLHISPHALGRMWEQQTQQVERLHALSSSHCRHRSKLSAQLEEAQRKHDLLVELNRKHQDHKRHLREFKDRIQQQRSVQNKLREQRQQIARAKKYHNEYHVQHRARLMKARTKEERMFRQLFEEGLELQKLRLREQRASAREQQLEHQRRHQDQMESLENYYKDQFSLLAEKLAQEREEIQVRKQAQEKALQKMKRELRSRMEREINQLQEIIIRNDEDDHFQELEVQRLRNQIHMASFQYNTSCLH